MLCNAAVGAGEYAHPVAGREAIDPLIPPHGPECRIHCSNATTQSVLWATPTAIPRPARGEVSIVELRAVQLLPRTTSTKDESVLCTGVDISRARRTAPAGICFYVA